MHCVCFWHQPTNTFNALLCEWYTSYFLFLKHLKDKKHSENTDISTSVTFDLNVWPWPYFKVKKAYVIRCRLLYCTLVSGMVSVSEIVFIFCDLWPSPVTFGICQGPFYLNHYIYLMLLYIGIKYEVCWLNRIWNMDYCLQKTLIIFFNLMTSQGRHHQFKLYEIQRQIFQLHI